MTEGIAIRFLVSEDCGYFGSTIGQVLARNGFSGAVGQALSLHIADSEVLLVGVGSRDLLTPEKYGRAAGIAGGKVNAGEVITIDTGSGFVGPSIEQIQWAILEGLFFGSTRANLPGDHRIHWRGVVQPPEQLIERARITGIARAKVAEWVDAPPNKLSPEALASQATAWVSKWGVRVKSYTGSALGELGAGGLIAVGSGSSRPPVLLHLSSGPADVEPELLVVGKGITFDSGGLSLKSADELMNMKFDMAGAAAAIAGVAIAAQMNPRIRVDAVVALAENLTGSSAFRPGDVVTTIGGKSIEILNTDFEGRVVLADALSFGQRLQPKRIVDFATLTVSVVLALGTEIAGFFSNNDEMAVQIKNSADLGGEPLWRMPLDSRYDVQLTSDIADIKNFPGNKYGRSITAARFLSQFVDEATPWTHIDISGPAWAWNESTTKGGTGFGVATISRFLEMIDS